MRQEVKASNARRAMRAERTVRHYSRTPGFRGKADWEADITDLFTDLRHFCARGRLDFDEMVQRSRHHYNAERKEESIRRRMRKQAGEPKCPNCGNRLEYEPDQDGACNWHCTKCGWSQHVPAPRRRIKTKERRKNGR